MNPNGWPFEANSLITINLCHLPHKVRIPKDWKNKQKRGNLHEMNTTAYMLNKGTNKNK